MSFDNIDDFQQTPDVTKKDHIILVSVAAQVGRKLRPRPPHPDWRSSQIMALAAKLTCKSFSNRAAFTLIRDIYGNGI